MRRRTRSLVEGALALCVLGLAAALVLPWPSDAGVTVPTGGGSPRPPAALPESARATSLPAEAAAALFVRPVPQRAPARASPGPPPPAASPAPSWLKYVGYSSPAEGQRRYFIKDTRSGRLITLTPGERAGPWSLDEDRRDTLVVVTGAGERYVVVKGKP
jgi:hypothetical protein